MARTNIEVTLPQAVTEVARNLNDLGLGFTLAGMLKPSRTANEAAMRAIIESLSDDQMADLALLGANLVETINEVGKERGAVRRSDAEDEAERARQIEWLKAERQAAYEADAEPGPECHYCETNGVNCRLHRTPEQRARAGW